MSTQHGPAPGDLGPARAADGADRWERMADNLTDVIIEVDTAGLVTYVSSACDRVLGYRPEQIIGQPTLDWVHEADRARVEEEHGTIFETPEPVTSTYRCRRSDGTLAWIESISQRLSDPVTGKPVGVLGCCRDVTERIATEKRLHTSQTMLADAQAVAHIGSWEWDVAADRITWSDELYRIFGVEPGAFAATYEAWLGHIHPEDRALADETVKRAFADHRPFRFHHRVLLPDGEMRIVLGRGRVEVAPDGAVARMVGTGQDVTEQRRLEQELERARCEFERSNRELERFAFDASHDLSEPLAVMASAAEWLCDNRGECMGEDGRQMAGSIVDGAERMRMMISDLLDYARVAAEPPVRERVDSAQVVAQAADLLAETIAERHAVVRCGDLPALEAHPAQLAHVFQNLISNALKFTAEGRTPEVEIAAARADGAWRFSVADNGIGVDPEQRERVFELFRRARARDLYAGTGIGLSLCQRIVERHGGRIWVEPRPGGGSVFSFTVPDTPPREGDPRATGMSVAGDQSSSPSRIASATADARSETPSF